MSGAPGAGSLPGMLEAARRGLLLACLLGCSLALDPASAEPLAPKSLWLALAWGWLPALAALRLWAGQPLRPPSRAASLALLALAAALTLAWLLSPLGLLSRGPWQQGLLAALLLLGAVDLAAEEGGRRSLLRALSLAALLAGGLALAQRLGLAWGPWADSARAFGGRLPASFGNPNFAGGFFALLLPLLVQQALAGEGGPWRRLAALAAGLSLLGLVCSGSKAAWLGLGAAAALAGHLLFWSGAADAQRRRALSRLGLGLALALGLGLALAPAESRQRVLAGPAAWSESVQFRLHTWRGSLRLWKARPLLGWGPGSFAAAYPAFRPAEAMRAQSQRAYEVTAPENWPLQLLAELGLLGLGAALWLLTALGLPLRRRARRWAEDPDSGLALALLCSLAASLACNLASLDAFLPSTALPLLLLLGLAAGLAEKPLPAFSLNAEPYARGLVALGLALLACAPALPAFLRLQAARDLQAGRLLSQSGRHAEASAVYGRALLMDPSLLEARYLQGLNALDLGGERGLAEAEAAFAELALWAPDYLQLHALRGRLRAAQGRFEEAAAEYAAQLRLDPWDKASLRELASLLAARGRLAEARAVLEAAALRWPGDPDIPRNLERLRRAAGKARGR